MTTTEGKPGLLSRLASRWTFLRTRSWVLRHLRAIRSRQRFPSAEGDDDLARFGELLLDTLCGVAACGGNAGFLKRRLRRSILPATPDPVLDACGELGALLADSPLLDQAGLFFRFAVYWGERRSITSEEFASALIDLGKFESNAGRDEEALHLFERGRDMAAKTSGADSERYLEALIDIANTWRNLGDIERAMPELYQAAAVLNHVPEPTLQRIRVDTYIAQCLSKRARRPGAMGLVFEGGQVYQEQAHLIARREAERLLRNAVALEEMRTGKESADYAKRLSTLSAFLYEWDDFAAALPLLQQAIEIWYRVLPPFHPHLAWATQLEGMTVGELHGWAAAAPVFRRALDLGERVLDPESTQLAELCELMAAASAAEGQVNSAWKLASQANRIYGRLVHNAYVIGSEREALRRIAQTESGLNLTLTLLSDKYRAAAGDDRQTWVRQALKLVQERKAITLGYSWRATEYVRKLSDLAGIHREYRGDFEKLTGLRKRILQAFYLGSETGEIRFHRDQIAAWRAEADEIETQLRAAIPDFPDQEDDEGAGRAVVSLHLPQDGILIDYVQYRYSNFGPDSEEDGDSTRYIAFVAWPDSSGEGGDSSCHVETLDVGEARTIDSLIALFRSSLGLPNDPRGAYLQVIEQHPFPDRIVARALYDRLLGLAFNLVPKGVRRCYLALDGDLVMLPFDALLTSDGKPFLREGGPILSRLSNSDDLQRLKQQPHGKPAKPVVVAIDYASGSDSKFLEHGRHEGEFVAKRLRVDKLDGTLVNKPRLIELLSQSPVIAHLVGHLESLAEDDPGLGVGDNPYFRYGLRLDPGEGQVSDHLYASDLLQVDMKDTGLVVLSFCGTATGLVIPGHGVYGMQRAFEISGARTVVATLWDAGDEACTLLMKRFYSYLLDERKGAAEALHLAKLDVMEIRNDPRDWATFVLQGDPGPVSYQV